MPVCMPVCWYAAHVCLCLLPPKNKGTARGGFESTDVVPRLLSLVGCTAQVVLAVLAVLYSARLRGRDQWATNGAEL